jgi:hypothetical protein
MKILRSTFMLPKQKPLAAIKVVRTQVASVQSEGYAPMIDRSGVLALDPR